MAQPYTTKQLDYFRAMLAILNVGIGGAGAEKSADLAPAALPEFVRQPPTAKGAFSDDFQGDQVFKKDGGGSNQETASILASGADVPAFFENRPQQINAHAPVALTALFAPVGPVSSEANASQAFADESINNHRRPAFAGQAKAASVEADEAHVLDATVDSDSYGQGCLAFFSGLPWQAGENAASAPDVATATDTPEHFVSADPSCSAFFRALPWQAEKAVGTQKMALITLMASNDITKIADLATQSAILSAQRGAQTYQPSAGPSAAAFFQSLPW